MLILINVFINLSAVKFVSTSRRAIKMRVVKRKIFPSFLCVIEKQSPTTNKKSLLIVLNCIIILSSVRHTQPRNQKA